MFRKNVQVDKRKQVQNDTIVVRVKPEFKKKLQDKAFESNISVSSLIKLIVTRELGKDKELEKELEKDSRGGNDDGNSRESIWRK